MCGHRRFDYRVVGILTLIIWSACLGRTHAEVAEQSDIEFRCVAWHEPEQGLYIYNTQEYIRLDLRVGKRSKQYSMPANSRINLFTRSAVTGDFVEFTHCLVPANHQRLLILVHLLDANDPESCRVDLVADPFGRSTKNELIFLNLSEDSLTTTLDGEVFEISSGESVSASHVSSAMGGFLPFYVNDVSGNRVYESRIYAQANQTKLVCIYPPEESHGRFSVRFYTERDGQPQP